MAQAQKGIDASGTYRISCTNGAFYLGSAVRLCGRWKRHIRELRRGVHGNQRLQRTFDKYGETSLSFETLTLCDKNELQDEEQRLLDLYFGNEGCLNLSEKSMRPPSSKGKKRSAETCKKIGDIHRGKTVTEETRQKLSEANLGKTLSEETRRRMSSSRSGEKHYMFGTHRLCDGLAAHNIARRGVPLAASRIEKMRKTMTGKRMPHRGKPWTEARRLAHLRSKGLA